ncbi:MAG: diguanylate cyclase [Spirulinaceae cyanobacterium RM2_2_10]|nr:diguanylate cyclase [Spirulinaceae cyanobacterium RM2_2_10]
MGDDLIGKSYQEFFPVILDGKSCCHDIKADNAQWLRAHIYPLNDHLQGLYLICLVDITEHKQAEAALWLSEQRLEGILNSIEDVVWSSSADGRQLLYLNPATELVYGRPLSDFLLDPTLWLETIHPDDRPLITQQLEQFQQAQDHLAMEYRILRPDGSTRWLSTRCRLVCSEDGTPARVDGISTDITARKQAEAQLRHSAFYDALTDLPNRALFLERLWHTLRRAKRRGSYWFAVLFLDLDSFKVINDSLGHTVGDHLLVAIARRLERCLRPSDTLARLGGDEFTILLEDITDEREATQIAQTIRQRTPAQPFQIGDREVYSNASIGIAFSHLAPSSQPQFGRRRAAHSGPDYNCPEDLLRDADTAMYRAKAAGKGCYAIFDRQMHDQAIARLTLETDLRRALEREEFSLHYQPIVSLITHQLAGFEALLRWSHPERGMISPSEFIPLAEETGAIVPWGNGFYTPPPANYKPGNRRIRNITISPSASTSRIGNCVSRICWHRSTPCSATRAWPITRCGSRSPRAC